MEKDAVYLISPISGLAAKLLRYGFIGQGGKKNHCCEENVFLF